LADSFGRNANGTVVIVRGNPSPGLGSISGNVFIDADSDNVRDGGEVGQAGWAVSLMNAVGTPVATSTTDGSGDYLFGALAPGSYTVKVVIQGPWKLPSLDIGGQWLWPPAEDGKPWLWPPASDGGRLVHMDSGVIRSGVDFPTKMGPVLIHVRETMGVNTPMGGVVPGPQIHIRESLTVNLSTFGESDPAPGNGSITGQIALQGIFQPSRFALTGAFVVAGMGLTGSSTLVSVQSDGSFVIPDLPPGDYGLTASADGFVARSLSNISVGGPPTSVPSVTLRGGLSDSDNVVSIRDISAIAASFGQSISGRADGQGRFVDIDANGAIDILDISNAASNFGVTSAQEWDD